MSETMIKCAECTTETTEENAIRTWWHHPDSGRYYCPKCWESSANPQLPPLRMRRIAAAHERER